MMMRHVMKTDNCSDSPCSFCFHAHQVVFVYAVLNRVSLILRLFSERRFVRILMQFGYMTSVRLPDDVNFPGTWHMKIAGENDEEAEFLEAVYE